MDYVVGSVAALVSGNVTPNRPKFLKRALTPIKHQPSPNVTPKSEVVEDRSIFLSPTLQKKKAIVKKSPKRIFENPDLDVSNDGEGSPNTKSPKADKVKKHLKEELEETVNVAKSPKSKLAKVKDASFKNESWIVEDEGVKADNSQDRNEHTPKKKKKQKSTLNVNNDADGDTNNLTNNNSGSNDNVKGKKKKNKSFVSLTDTKKDDDDEKENSNKLYDQESQSSPKKKKKLEIAEQEDKADKDNLVNQNKSVNPENIQAKKKNKRRKNKAKPEIKEETPKTNIDKVEDECETNDSKKKKKKGKQEITVNPNAVTDKDTDSEHDSDNEIESENEENNKEVLDTGPVESSDEEGASPKKALEKKETASNKEPEVETEEQVKRTLFVGNVPFSAKCKKEIKKIFSKYGQIETVRIRTVPVKDGRVTPKLAIIKNELHPERSTVNVYVKFCNASSVNEALAENGTVLNDHHLRVTRSDCTGAEHDPKSSIFLGNLPFAIEDETLRQKFQQCGEIESVRIIRDKKTNAGKGFGYVNFKSKDAVELALALTEEDLTIKNRIIRVKRCTQITHKQKAQQDNKSNFRGNPARSFQNNRGGMKGNFSRQRNYGQETQRSFGRGNGQGRFGSTNGQTNFRDRQQKPSDNKADGAYRRLMNKRKHQDDGGDGPKNKKQRNINQPGKKVRKEFVGMTAEKKKKHKVAKGHKKKKANSEILTKQ